MSDEPPKTVYVADRRRAEGDKDIQPCLRFLQAIGIDPSNAVDAKQLRETIRWAQEEQQKRVQLAIDLALTVREKRNRNLAFIYGTAATVISIVGSAIFNHFYGGH